MVDKGTAGGGNAPRRRARRWGTRRLWRKGLALALPIALVLLASLAPTVTARAARERSPEQSQLLLEKRAAVKEQRAAARKASQEAATQAREAEAQRSPEEGVARQRHKGRGNERLNVVVTSTCTLVTWTYRKFPNLPSNAVIEKITIAHMAPVFQIARFEGEGAVVLSPINPPRGKARVDTGGKWRDFTGKKKFTGFDIHSKKECPPAPAFTIEKLQRITGAFVKSPLIGLVGQTVEYEMIVRNTGNVPLVFSNFTDPHCDAETIKGGPGSNPLLPGPTPETGETSTYTCSHQLTSTEQYDNNATVTGTPGPGNGSAITHESNTVVVNAPRPNPAFKIEKRQKIEGEYTTSPLTGKVGQTVSYEMIVKNTGNTPLTLSSFTDEHCDSGTIAGGPSKALEAGESAAYLCQHTLTGADQTAGFYTNEASVIGTPPEEGPLPPQTSNKVTVTLSPAQTAPLLFVAYADNHGGQSGLPSPWKGASGVTFIGCGFGGSDRCPMSNGADIYDAGAIRIGATASSGAVSVTGASVTIGPCTYEPWPGLSATIQPGGSLILTQTGKHRCVATSTSEQDNFDTSESFLMSPQYQQFLKTGSCSNDGYIPAITLTLNGTTTTVNDSGQVLNGGGIDLDICHKASEAVNWVQLPSTAARRFARMPTCTTRRHGHHARGRAELCPRRLRGT